MASKIVQFGENVQGYDIPVLNERELRAAAGLYFLPLFVSLMMVLFKGNLTMVKYIVTFFLVDFIIRIFINPKYSPSLILARLIVARQNPEYVGAPQKKFAWWIGLVLAALMFVHIVILNAYSIIAGLSCLACLLFLFFESAFGICLGCKVYAWLNKDKVLYCPGEVCEPHSRQNIQKTSKQQLLIILGFIIFMFIVVFLFNENFSQPPRLLWSVFSQEINGNQ
ncbi:MAG: DUF4395 domain-containing protein [Proteobacteria bacterium]|nr:DUF4395 domain-containing protein [Pseudomonadota bacterium]